MVRKTSDEETELNDREEWKELEFCVVCDCD